MGGASTHRWCRAITIGFALCYLGALGVFAVGTFGLFAQDRDPLAGVFLLPLGLPWNWIGAALPGTAPLWLGLLTPALNLVLLSLLCRLRRTR